MTILNNYQKFVQEVTSKESSSTMALNNHLIDLDRDTGVNIALLLTGAIIASEGESMKLLRSVF